MDLFQMQKTMQLIKTWEKRWGASMTCVKDSLIFLNFFQHHIQMCVEF